MTAARHAKQSPHARASLHLASLALLYSASSLATFAHEIGWTRLARTWLGGDVRATTAVLAALFTGMGAGAAAAPFVRRKLGALRGFAWVELAAAIYAAGLPWSSALLGVVAGNGPPTAAASFALATLVFLPATFAMGAGLPLLASARQPHHEHGSAASAIDAGVVYGAGGVASAVGGLVASFVILPAAGLVTLSLSASALQVGAALLAFRLVRGTGDTGITSDSDAAAPIAHRTHGLALAQALRATPILVAVFLSGIATIALQGTYARLASLAAGPSTQGFALVGAVYVAALGIGAWAGSALVRRMRALPAFALLLMGAAIAVLARIETTGHLPTDAVSVFHAGEGLDHLGLTWLVARVVGLPVALAAAAFPFAVASLANVTSLDRARVTGRVLAASALGNLLGAVLGPFAWVPSLGLARTLVVCAACLGAAALLAIVVALVRQRRDPTLTPALGAAFVAALAAAFALGRVAPAHFDPATLASGPFLYAGPQRPALGDVVFSHEGRDATVVVRDAKGERLLQIDGKVDASTAGDAPTQLLVGLLPTMLAASPEQHLLIGLGSGQTADAMRSVPGVRRVDVAELVDGVRFAAPFFAKATHDVLRDPRVHVEGRDGALWLRDTNARWDVIVSQPSNPWVSGMGDLFARETLLAGRARLRPHGVFAAWFHVYATDLAIVRSIARTFSSVFPEAQLWELVRGEDYLLVGFADDAPSVDLDRLAARAAAPDVAGLLARANVPNAECLLGRLVASGRAVDDFSRTGELLSVRDGRLEAWAARFLYHDASRDALDAFAAMPNPFAGFRWVARTPAGAALKDRAHDVLEAGSLGRRLVIAALDRQEDRAIALGERAVGLLDDDPALVDALATIYLARAKGSSLALDDGAAQEDLLHVLELEPTARTRADALTVLGDLELRGHRPEHAFRRYLEARAVAPMSPDIADRLSVALEQLGERDDAERERQLARRLRGL